MDNHHPLVFFWTAWVFTAAKWRMCSEFKDTVGCFHRCLPPTPFSSLERTSKEKRGSLAHHKAQVWFYGNHSKLNWDIFLLQMISQLYFQCSAKGKILYGRRPMCLRCVCVNMKKNKNNKKIRDRITHSVFQKTQMPSSGLIPTKEPLEWFRNMFIQSFKTP